MGGRSNTQSSQPPALGALQVQTSTAGLAVPLVWGRPRIGGNLLWYDDFVAIPVTEPAQGGGKGGGGAMQGTTTYIYEAAVILALAGQQLNGVPSAWKGKQRYSGGSVLGKISSLSYTTVIPSGGVVVVPSASLFKASVSVLDPDWRESTGGE